MNDAELVKWLRSLANRMWRYDAACCESAASRIESLAKENAAALALAEALIAVEWVSNERGAASQ